MGKGKLGAGILAVLILGILIGYFVIPWVFPTEATSARQKYFVIQNLDAVNHSVSEWTDIPELNISFSTLQNEEVTFYYSSVFKMLRDSGDMSVFSFTFVFKIDGLKVGASEYFSFGFESNSTSMLFYPITYRLVRTGLGAGTHNVSVSFARSAGGPSQTWATLNVLSVQIT